MLKATMFPRLIARMAQRWLADRRGNVGPLLAIMVVPIIGAFAIASETGSWYTLHRSEQNAADSAAMAAALKGATAEGTSVATSYGYTTNGTTVTVSSTSTPTAPAACPTGALAGATCYQVAITRKVPVYLARVVGYDGDTTIGTTRAKNISAKAIAGLTVGTQNFCLIGLNSLTLNGGPNTDLTGCQLLSGGDMACNGNNSDTGVAEGYAVGTNKNGSCGTLAVSSYAAFSGDPEATTVANNMTNVCSGGYTALAAGAAFPILSAGTNCLDFGGATHSLTASQTINNANTVVVIKNGGLNLSSFTLSTAGSGSVTMVFTGATGANAFLQSSGGQLNIAAPSSGVWKGMALVQDPNLTGQNINVPGAGTMNSRDFNFSGGSNSISLYLSGLIYMPNAEFDLTGSINHASNGYACIGIIAKTIVASGTNSIFANPTSECRQQGLTLPTVPMVALLQ